MPGHLGTLCPVRWGNLRGAHAPPPRRAAHRPPCQPVPASQAQRHNIRQYMPAFANARPCHNTHYRTLALTSREHGVFCHRRTRYRVEVGDWGIHATPYKWAACHVFHAERESRTGPHQSSANHQHHPRYSPITPNPMRLTATTTLTIRFSLLVLVPVPSRCSSCS